MRELKNSAGLKKHQIYSQLINQLQIQLQQLINQFTSILIT